MFRNFIHEFCLSVVEIIETRKRFTLPKFAYYIMIVTLFFQVAGRYILSSYEIKPITDEKLETIAKINEVSPGTFLLYMTGKDQLTIVFFILIDLFLVFYFVYLGVYTFCKIYRQNWLSNYSFIFDGINQLLNLFLSLYWWMLFTPLCEINSGMMVVGANSFMMEYRLDENYDRKPLWQILIGTSGSCMTILSGGIMIYCFRNHVFMEQNLLKRKFHFIQIIMLMVHLLLIYFYYLNLTIILPLKHFLGHLIGITTMVDFLTLLPFRNEDICRFYIASYVTFQVSMIGTSVWIFTDWLPETNMFYFIMFISPPLAGMINLIYTKRLESIVFHTSIDENLNTRMDQTLELLLEYSKIKHKSNLRFILISTMTQHKKACTNVTCPCRFSNKRIKSGLPLTKVDQTDQVERMVNVDPERIQMICEFLLKGMLADRRVRAKPTLYEHFLLKLISFFQLRKNPLLAFYQLKIHQFGLLRLSFYFRLIAQVLAKTLQSDNSFLQRSVKMNREHKDVQDNPQKVATVQALHLDQEMVTDILDDLISTKLKLVKGLAQHGLNSRKYQTQFTKNMRHIDRLMQRIQQKITEIERRLGPKRFDSLLYLKIQQLVQRFAFNNVAQDLVYQRKIFELIQMDHCVHTVTINNYNLHSGNTIHLKIGMVHHIGELKPVHPSSLSNVANFFGYNPDRFQQLKSIKPLLPDLIAEHHDQMVHQFLLLPRRHQHVLATREIFIQDGDGFIFKASLNLRNDPYDTSELVYFATLTKHLNTNAYLIFDECGRISCISRNFIDMLNLEPNQLYSIIGTHCYQLFPKLLDHCLNVNHIITAILESPYSVKMLKLITHLKCSLSSFNIKAAEPSQAKLTLTNKRHLEQLRGKVNSFGQLRSLFAKPRLVNLSFDLYFSCNKTVPNIKPISCFVMELTLLEKKKDQSTMQMIYTTNVSQTSMVQLSSQSSLPRASQAVSSYEVQDSKILGLPQNAMNMLCSEENRSWSQFNKFSEQEHLKPKHIMLSDPPIFMKKELTVDEVVPEMDSTPRDENYIEATGKILTTVQNPHKRMISFASIPQYHRYPGIFTNQTIRHSAAEDVPENSIQFNVTQRQSEPDSASGEIESQATVLFNIIQDLKRPTKQAKISNSLAIINLVQHALVLTGMVGIMVFLGRQVTKLGQIQDNRQFVSNITSSHIQTVIGILPPFIRRLQIGIGPIAVSDYQNYLLRSSLSTFYHLTNTDAVQFHKISEDLGLGLEAQGQIDKTANWVFRIVQSISEGKLELDHQIYQTITYILEQTNFYQRLEIAQLNDFADLHTETLSSFNFITIGLLLLTMLLNIMKFHYVRNLRIKFTKIMEIYKYLTQDDINELIRFFSTQKSSLLNEPLKKLQQQQKKSSEKKKFRQLSVNNTSSPLLIYMAISFVINLVYLIILIPLVIKWIGTEKTKLTNLHESQISQQIIDDCVMNSVFYVEQLNIEGIISSQNSLLMGTLEEQIKVLVASRAEQLHEQLAQHQASINLFRSEEYFEKSTEVDSIVKGDLCKTIIEIPNEIDPCAKSKQNIFKNGLSGYLTIQHSTMQQLVLISSYEEYMQNKELQEQYRIVLEEYPLIGDKSIKSLIGLQFLAIETEISNYQNELTLLIPLLGFMTIFFDQVAFCIIRSSTITLYQFLVSSLSIYPAHQIQHRVSPSMLKPLL